MNAKTKIIAILITIRNFYNFTRTRANKYARARYYNKFHFCKVDFANLTIFAFFFKKKLHISKKNSTFAQNLKNQCLTNKIQTIMKTLKELKEKCTLLCEHKQPAFNVDGINKSSLFSGKPNTCALFTDNKGTYYLYKRIIDATIQIYYNYNEAIKRYIDFIKNTCENQ